MIGLARFTKLTNVECRKHRPRSFLQTIAHAVIGGQAVFAYTERLEEGGARLTRDVDVLFGKDDFESAVNVHATLGIRLRWEERGLRDFTAVHAVPTGERVQASESEPSPYLEGIKTIGDTPFASLASVVRMKLVACRTIDRVHLRDLAGVGLIDATWPVRYPPELAERLRHVLATPDG